MWRGERSSWRCTNNGGCRGIPSVHRGITKVHRGITKIHSGAARRRQRRIINPIYAAFIKGLGDNYIILLYFLFRSVAIMEPMCCLKRTREISYELCIIYQERRGKLKLLKASSAGIESIKEATEMQRKLRLCDYARDAVDRQSSIFSQTQTDIQNLK